ncbi:MAG: RNA methyltransferase [Alphaproteobacteria bacterium HGW-Alphaproteobacteria-12]|nr:MAG: RNA methyltransferase [Alphaproteobacteria bacterium HGW-Alphaproteobacteria-12]
MGGVRVIESPQNQQVKRWLALTETRGIKKHGAFLLSGRKTVPEALARHGRWFTAVLAQKEADLDALRLPERIDRYILAKPVFDMLDTNGTGYPLLAGDVPEMANADFSTPPKGIELVCALGDPSNLGALLRSAAAFGVARIVLMEGAAHPFHPKALRGGANAQFAMTFLRGGNWAALGGARGTLVALDGAGEDMNDYDWPRDLRLVLGEEGQGVPRSLTAARLAIATTGVVESLNATVAASIALHAWFKARG